MLVARVAEENVTSRFGVAQALVRGRKGKLLRLPQGNVKRATRDLTNTDIAGMWEAHRPGAERFS